MLIIFFINSPQNTIPSLTHNTTVGASINQSIWMRWKGLSETPSTGKSRRKGFAWVCLFATLAIKYNAKGGSNHFN
jgi:hypothetical protein